MKITKQQLKQIIKEEIVRLLDEGDYGHMEPAVRTLAHAGIAEHPESVRKELMQLVAGLDPQNPEEVKELARMVAQLMDASQENIQGGYGLEEQDGEHT